MAKKLPSIIDTCDSLLLLDGSIVALDSQKFLVWLENNQSFRFDCGLVGKDGYTARKERTDYWYAYKKIAGKLHKVYIGNGTSITMARLLEVAEKLQNSVDVQLKQQLHTEVKHQLQKDDNELQSEVVQQLCLTVKQLQETIALLTQRIEVLEGSNKVDENLQINEQLQKENEQLKAENQELKFEVEYKRQKLQDAYDTNIQALDRTVIYSKQLETAEQRILQLENNQHQPQFINQTLDDFLTTLKLGKQSPDYKAAKRWVSKFIDFVISRG